MVQKSSKTRPRMFRGVLGSTRFQERRGSDCQNLEMMPSRRHLVVWGAILALTGFSSEKMLGLGAAPEKTLKYDGTLTRKGETFM